jgi:nucleotide-binding universal stress UspA family protein
MYLRTLLVPVDFSLRSRQALRYSVGLARASGAALHVLHVVPAPSAAHLRLDAVLGRPMPHASEVARAEAERRLAELIEVIPAAGVTLERSIEAGSDAAATIVRVAVELPADLIVIGTHARTGVAEWMLGSVAHRVIGCAPCPVVTLRGDEVHPTHPSL